MLQAKRTPRLHRIMLVMLLSMLALAGFLGYWLRGAYLSERAQLQKDIRQVLTDARSRMTDSLIVANLIRPLELELKTPGGGLPGKKRIDSFYVRDTGTFTYRVHPRRARLPVDVRVRVMRDSGAPHDESALQGLSEFTEDSFQHFSAEPDRLSPDSYYSITRSMITKSNGRSSVDKEYRMIRRGDPNSFSAGDSLNETMLRSVKLLITSFSDLPGGAQQQLSAVDTSQLRPAYQQALHAASIPVTFFWQADTARNLDGTLLVDESSPEGFTLLAQSYRGTLFRRLSAEMLFSVFLISLTLLAFGITYRALRSQMQLAAIRNDLISNMSHELRTPVSTVKVALEALSEPEVLQNKTLAADYLQMAGLELARLELLINKALQSALLEGGRLQIERKPVDVAALAEQMLRSMQHRFLQQGGSLTMRRQGSEFRLLGDALHLQGVFVNILDNALKYTGPEPAVSVLVSEQADTIRIEIEDDGPGIPAQYRSKVFEKFYRIPTGNEHSVKGYGLGLNYAAWVVQTHGGDISVSTRPEGGSRFEIRLPKSDA